jgi:hypothetical protein
VNDRELEALELLRHFVAELLHRRAAGAAALLQGKLVARASYRQVRREVLATARHGLGLGLHHLDLAFDPLLVGYALGGLDQLGE